MPVSDPPVATSLAGILVIYVLCPLVVAAIIGGIAAVTALRSRVSLHGAALAELLKEVNPPTKPSLRELLGDIRAKQGDMAGDIRVATERMDGAEKLADERWIMLHPDTPRQARR